MTKKMIATFLLSLLCSVAFGKPSGVVAGFTVISHAEEQAKVVCDNVELPAQSMPRVRSQGTLPLCQSYVGATIFQYQLCKRTGVADCSQVAPQKEISPLSVLNLIHQGVSGFMGAQRLHVFSERGAAVDGILKANEMFVFNAESCFPMDKFINKYGDESSEKMVEILATIQKELNKAKTEADICTECIERVAKDVGTNISIQKIKKTMVSFYEDNEENKKKKVRGFEQRTSEHVLYDMLLEECEDIIDLDSSKAPKAASFPQRDADKSLEKMISKVQDVLLTGNPVAFDGVCQSYEKGKCQYTLDGKVMNAGHAVVIRGYKKICDNKNCNSGCRRAFRIQNSWGEDWQRENNDGLVDADDLFSFVTYKGDDKLKGVIPSKDRMTNSLSWMY